MAVLDGHGRAGVLVDADAEQLRRLGDDHQQPAVAVALVEVLVDHRRAQQPQPGGDLGHPLLGGRAADAERDHVRRLDAGAGRRAGDDRSTLVGADDGVAERRAADDRGQLELVATGHEDAGGVVDEGDQVGVVRVVAALGPHGRDVAGPEPPEQRVVHLDDLVAEARRGRDDHEARVGPAAGRDEVLEDRASAELVLGAADDHQRPAGARVGASAPGDRGPASARSGMTGKASRCQSAPVSEARARVGPGSRCDRLPGARAARSPEAR